MSIANIVQLLLKIDVNDDIRAANITANIKPLAPTKIKALNAMMELEFYIECTAKTSTSLRGQERLLLLPLQ